MVKVELTRRRSGCDVRSLLRGGQDNWFGSAYVNGESSATSASDQKSYA
jgi:hypothetical protein